MPRKTKNRATRSQSPSVDKLTQAALHLESALNGYGVGKYVSSIAVLDEKQEIILYVSSNRAVFRELSDTWRGFPLKVYKIGRILPAVGRSRPKNRPAVGRIRP